MHASYRKLSEELKNGIEILVGLAVKSLYQKRPSYLLKQSK